MLVQLTEDAYVPWGKPPPNTTRRMFAVVAHEGWPSGSDDVEQCGAPSAWGGIVYDAFPLPEMNA